VLEDLITKRRQVLERGRRMEGRTDSSGVLKLKTSILQGDSLMTLVRAQVAEIQEHEKKTMEAGAQTIASYDSGSLIIIICFGLITAIMIIYGFITISRGQQEKEEAVIEKLRTMDELKQSEARYRNLNESSNDAIIIMDENIRIISWNKMAYTLFGYTAEEAISKPVTLIIPPKYLPGIERSTKKFLKAGMQKILGTRVEMAGKNKKGKEFPVEVTISHWTVDDKHYFSAGLRDITQQRKNQEKLEAAMEELQRSNEDLEQFAYVASHDLQEPLRKIRAFGDRLTLKFSETEMPGSEYVSRMTEAAERMQVLINDLLSFSRVSKDTGERETVDLNAIFKIVIDDLQVAINETKAVIDVDPMPVLKNANRTQMLQLFQNLISNSLKFRKPDVNPEINIKYSFVNASDLDYEELKPLATGSYHQFTVADNGIGFDMKYLDKIFTIFQRLHGRHEYKGTGIGLAVCRKICKNHDGYITARSTNSGSEFIVLIPAH
ncbi:MAG TPA: PAS domain S-box protein, partial [Bacteroidia bacterium]|nr:PAS domain S-box protein [Bacteroidia bacterium]